MEVPNYGPVTNGTGMLGTAAALMNVPLNPCNGTVSSHSNQWWPTPLNKPLNEILDEYQKDIETLKEENEFLKNKVDVLEIQLKFMLNRFAEVEKFTKSRKD